MANAVPTNCPACADAKNMEVIHRGLRFRGELTIPVWRCKSCNHRWLPTTDDEQRQIEKSYSAEYTGFRIDDFFNQTVRAELEQRLSVLVPPPAKLLDVGCGNGEFLALAQEFGYDSLGIDVSQDGVAIASSKGLNAKAVNYLSWEFPDRYKLITMWDVMEHLQNPHAFVSRANELLDGGGVLILKIPSFGAFNFSVLQIFRSRASVLLGAPDHMQYFTRNSLEQLLKRAGFPEVVWFPSKKFRTYPPTGSLKRRLSRFIQRWIGRLSGNENLYLVATRTPVASDTKKRLTH